MNELALLPDFPMTAAPRDALAPIDQGDAHLAVLATRARRDEYAFAELVRALEASAEVKAVPGGDRLFTQVSPSAGQLPILSADQVNTARATVNAIRGLSVGLLAAAAVLFAAAVASARGWRSIAVRRVGYSLLVVGAVVLVARALLAPALADALVSGETYRTAAHAAWRIATTQLRDTAIVILVCAGVLILAGLASGTLAPRRGRST